MLNSHSDLLTLKNIEMDQIKQRLDALCQRIAQAEIASGRAQNSVTLLAVSKTKPARDLIAAANGGQHCFGENYLQEALEKIATLTTALPDTKLIWHFIGAIQSNKTRDIAENFDWVHSVDRLKIARRLSDQRPATLPPLNVCLQVNISDEASKAGLSVTELLTLANTVAELPRLRLRGLMALPAPTVEYAAQRAAFASLRQMQQQLIADGLMLDTLSMGMSNDLEAAIAEGSTLVRVGSALFGPRIKT